MKRLYLWIFLLASSLPANAVQAATATYSGEASVLVSVRFIIPDLNDDDNAITAYNIPSDDNGIYDVTQGEDVAYSITASDRIVPGAPPSTIAQSLVAGKVFWSNVIANDCDEDPNACEGCEPYCDYGLPIEAVFDISLAAATNAEASGVGAHSNAGASAKIEFFDESDFIDRFEVSVASDNATGGSDADQFFSQTSYLPVGSVCG